MGFFKRYFYIFIAGFAAVIVFSTWAANYYLLVDNPERGTFGDMFGGLNALFSGCAFVGVIVAVLMQSAELRLQREELAETREVLDDQKEQLEAQSTTLIKQNFENTFFQLIQYYDAVLSGVGTESSSGKVYLKRLISNYSLQFQNKFGKDYSVDIGSASDFSEDFFGARAEAVESYFDTLLTIFRFIKNSSLENKQFYVEVIRSKMTTTELEALFYYGLNRSAGLRVHFEEFRFFKGLRVEKLCNTTLFNHYAPSSFHH